MDVPVASKTVVINNAQGMHARPATLFAELASGFESTIEVVRDSQVVDGKSILHVMTLAAAQGTELTIHANGADAKQAVDALAQLVESEFGEEENAQEVNQESSAEEKSA
jgi:phosphocarrier protein HPr